MWQARKGVGAAAAAVAATDKGPVSQPAEGSLTCGEAPSPGLVGENGSCEALVSQLEPKFG
eukprot:CAMPEP_0180676624 /NCGR_PEP_ID=MMETSP1037_2-20121125/67418_1 /TAXON_ID=632150 /ORGANISM="Azadinium spinosum, Strain 3D9" /LENGTH=60 /DNA_ID=CAMNT_0022706153 /DNA_START=185 /DNA_END=364 /DNA_ORIENTATION=+